MSTTAILCLVIVIVLACAAAGIFLLRRRGKKPEPAVTLGAEEGSVLAAAILEAVGGKANVTSLDYCTTRLRFELKSYSGVKEAALKEAGATGVVRPSKNVCQVVVGSKAQSLYDALKKQL